MRLARRKREKRGLEWVEKGDGGEGVEGWKREVKGRFWVKLAVFWRKVVVFGFEVAGDG